MYICLIRTNDRTLTDSRGGLFSSCSVSAGSEYVRERFKVTVLSVVILASPPPLSIWTVWGRGALGFFLFRSTKKNPYYFGSNMEIRNSHVVCSTKRTKSERYIKNALKTRYAKL